MYWRERCLVRAWVHVTLRAHLGDLLMSTHVSVYGTVQNLLTKRTT